MNNNCFIVVMGVLLGVTLISLLVFPARAADPPPAWQPPPAWGREADKKAPPPPVIPMPDRQQPATETRCWQVGREWRCRTN